MSKFSKNAIEPDSERDWQRGAARIILLPLILILFCAASVNSSHGQTFAVLSNFNSDIWNPENSLVQAPDGRLYGATGGNGIKGSYGGTLFGFSLVGDTLSTLHAFCAELGCPDGISSSGALVQDENGIFYGSSPGGGTNSIGTIFSVTPSRKFTTLYNFGSQSGDGINPYSGLLLARDGNFYGTTYNGGTAGRGTLFRITKEGTKSTIYNFCQLGNCADGSAPYGPLIQGANGRLYGTTAYSTNSCCVPAGTVFEITLGGQLTTLHTFCLVQGCPDGSDPVAGVIQSNNGTLYGTTYQGGAYNQGTVFKITPAGVITTIYSFCNCGDGAAPFGQLLQATDGDIYGTTNVGGANNYGTVFVIKAAGTVTTLHSFDTADGQYPLGGLLQATDGNLYGTTAVGGDSVCPKDAYGSCGTLFSLSLGLSPFVHPLTSFGRAGQSIFILGNNLEGSTGVTFNGVAANFTVLSANSIRATVPSNAATGIIQVVTARGTLNSNVPFTVISR